MALSRACCTYDKYSAIVQESLIIVCAPLKNSRGAAAFMCRRVHSWATARHVRDNDAHIYVHTGDTSRLINKSNFIFWIDTLTRRLARCQKKKKERNFVKFLVYSNLFVFLRTNKNKNWKWHFYIYCNIHMCYIIELRKNIV